MKVQMVEPQYRPYRPIDHAGRELVRTPHLQQPVSSHEPSRTYHAAGHAVQKQTRLLEQHPLQSHCTEEWNFTTSKAVSQCHPGVCHHTNHGLDTPATTWHMRCSRRRLKRWVLSWRDLGAHNFTFEDPHGSGATWFAAHRSLAAGHIGQSISLSLLVPADKTQNTAGIRS